MDPTKIGISLLHRGAEADLFLTRLGSWKAVKKIRVRKAYRNHQLDARIRRERTAREASALHEAKGAGVRTPSMLDVDQQDYSISMTFIEGEVMRDQLDNLSKPRRAEILQEIGQQIGKLHLKGLVHGDLTTSNIILSSNGLPFILDFGMSSHSTEPEDRGVDLHLLQRSISTSHTLDPHSSARAIIKGYRKVLGKKEAGLSLRKQLEIARRGRYFAIR